MPISPTFRLSPATRRAAAVNALLSGSGQGAVDGDNHNPTILCECTPYSLRVGARADADPLLQACRQIYIQGGVRQHALRRLAKQLKGQGVRNVPAAWGAEGSAVVSMADMLNGIRGQTKVTTPSIAAVLVLRRIGAEHQVGVCCIWPRQPRPKANTATCSDDQEDAAHEHQTMAMLAALLSSGYGADWTPLGVAAAALCPRGLDEIKSAHTMTWLSVRLVPETRSTWATWTATVNDVHRQRAAQHRREVAHVRALIGPVSAAARAVFPIDAGAASDDDDDDVDSLDGGQNAALIMPPEPAMEDDEDEDEDDDEAYEEDDDGEADAVDAPTAAKLLRCERACRKAALVATAKHFSATRDWAALRKLFDGMSDQAKAVRQTVCEAHVAEAFGQAVQPFMCGSAAASGQRTSARLVQRAVGVKAPKR